MKERPVGITQKFIDNHRSSFIREKRNELIKSLAKEGLSYGEISEIIRLDKPSISRIARFGKNISKPVAAS